MTPYLATRPEPERAACDAAFGKAAQVVVDWCMDLAILREQLGAEAFADAMWPQMQDHTCYRSRDEWMAVHEELWTQAQAGKRRAA
jgi:hypothetical protein